MTRKSQGVLARDYQNRETADVGKDDVHNIESADQDLKTLAQPRSRTGSPTAKLVAGPQSDLATKNSMNFVMVTSWKYHQNMSQDFELLPLKRTRKGPSGPCMRSIEPAVSESHSRLVGEPISCCHVPRSMTAPEPEARRSAPLSSKDIKTPASDPGQGLGQTPTTKGMAFVRKNSFNGMTYASISNEDAIPVECGRETSTWLDLPLRTGRASYRCLDLQTLQNAKLLIVNLSPNPHSYMAGRPHWNRRTLAYCLLDPRVYLNLTWKSMESVLNLISEIVKVNTDLSRTVPSESAGTVSWVNFQLSLKRPPSHVAVLVGVDGTDRMDANTISINDHLWPYSNGFEPSWTQEDVLNGSNCGRPHQDCYRQPNWGDVA
ncbi:hypothetical protein BS47DRAFT_1364905 [Hydnum rufescens UP504]|uniref:Uncharacterized protein n=1 Tax=Hydnum rufescens UP504 TaxID=1448309 RepID=A0A9P6AQ31_9AGAM|nr:hypothetical protein BS47DRAFT_1364905 [Hydnum rufescens UP504]